MTQEAYCSFEISKLLKEKGFDIHCDRGWGISCYDVKQSRMFSHGFDNKEEWISSPTHQMACAWLREVHNMHIDIDPSEGDWHPCVIELETWSSISDGNLKICDTYEDAVEAALKYTLENLI